MPETGIVYHGTSKTFGNFEVGTPSSSGVKSSGIFFTTSEEIARGYGNNVIAARLSIEDWVEFDFNGRSRVYFDGKARSPSELTNRIAEINSDLLKYGLDPDDDELLIDELEDAGWGIDHGLDYIDAIIMKNVDDSMDLFDGEAATHYVVFNSSQIQVVKEKIEERRLVEVFDYTNKNFLRSLENWVETTDQKSAIEISSMSIPLMLRKPKTIYRAMIPSNKTQLTHKFTSWTTDRKIANEFVSNPKFNISKSSDEKTVYQYYAKTNDILINIYDFVQIVGAEKLYSLGFDPIAIDSILEEKEIIIYPGILTKNAVQVS